MISKFLAFEIDFKSQKHAISSKYKEKLCVLFYTRRRNFTYN